MHGAMNKPSKKQRARKHGADESTESFRAATKAGGEPKPKINKKVKKLARCRSGSGWKVKAA
jgi:hypothetical protein